MLLVVAVLVAPRGSPGRSRDARSRSNAALVQHRRRRSRRRAWRGACRTIAVDAADARLHAASSSSSTRSVLLRTITSANAICCAPPGCRPAGPAGWRIDHGDDRVQPRPGAHVLVDEEGLRHRGRIGQAGGLDDDAVEAVRALHQRAQDADQVAAHGAADAAVVHLEHFLVRIDDEVVVHAELPELVDHDRIFAAVLLGEDAVQQRGLAGAQGSRSAPSPAPGRNVSPCQPCSVSLEVQGGRE